MPAIKNEYKPITELTTLPDMLNDKQIIGSVAVLFSLVGLYLGLTGFFD